MFYQCRSLAEIAIPDGVQEIGEIAFADCPALATLNQKAFQNCKSLTTVYFPTSKGPKKIAPNAFQDASPDLTLCGPVGSVAEKFAAKKESASNRVVDVASFRFASFSSAAPVKPKFAPPRLAFAPRGVIIIREAFLRRVLSFFTETATLSI